MSKVYYGVEPYTWKIICHSRTKGSKNGYHFGQLVDASKVAKGIKNAKNIKAKQAKVNAINNSSFNKSYVNTYNNNDKDYYNIGFDPTIAKRQLFRGKGNSDLVKNAYNLAAKVTRVKRLNDKYSKKADR